LNRRLISFIIPLFLAIGNHANVSCQEHSAEKQSPGFAFAPEFHFWQDLHSFYNQKDSAFKNRYFLEWNSGAEVAFFSYKNRFFLFLDMTVTVGLGKWPDRPILFDPREVDVGFGPMLEYRFSPVNIGLGLDHHCFHQIDNNPEESGTPEDRKIMYWNKFNLSVSSPNFRKNEFRLSLKSDDPLTLKRRFAWNASIFYSMHDFFGMDTSVVSWNQPYAVDLIGEVRFAVYRFKGIAAVLNAKTGAYITRTNSTLWNQQLGAELMATKGMFGLSLFVNWVVVDQLPPRQNKDRLIALGINGFN
jgi:hypothetical protein